MNNEERKMKNAGPDGFPAFQDLHLLSIKIRAAKRHTIIIHSSFIIIHYKNPWKASAFQGICLS